MTNTPELSVVENPSVIVIFHFGFLDSGQFVIQRTRKEAEMSFQKPITAMTLQDVQTWARQDGNSDYANAVGRYQMACP